MTKFNSLEDIAKLKKISVQELEQLKYLNLMKNRLSSLPEKIGQLKNLQELNLWNNKLSTLPESITQLENLQELNLGYNQLSMLPESITKLENLQKLNLWGNQLSTLPESIIQLEKLTHLDLGFNQLNAIPENIGQLKKLQTLKLGYNQLSKLPESITQLEKLTRLDLGYNQLSAIPENIGQLKQLKYLDLGNNKLSTLPENITQLENLQELNLGNNQLITLPEIEQLNCLGLRKNQLSNSESLEAILQKSLIEEPKLTQLQTLICIGNPLPKELIELYFAGITGRNELITPEHYNTIEQIIIKPIGKTKIITKKEWTLRPYDKIVLIAYSCLKEESQNLLKKIGEDRRTITEFEEKTYNKICNISTGYRMTGTNGNTYREIIKELME